MRSAEQLLEVIGNISSNNPDYVFHRVYRHLFNDDLILRAYLKLAPNEGNMSRGSDGSTIDGFGTKDIESIIEDLKSERFYPKPARREYIPKANGKLSAPEMAMQESLRGAADSEPMSA
jgi:retron-type reverse transcriptase